MLCGWLVLRNIYVMVDYDILLIDILIQINCIQLYGEEIVIWYEYFSGAFNV